uniref:Uncharacterized protein n=1 Tax=Rhodococcus erythropolis TaxID=1833 RepID=Q6XN03_RHOER|nr:hypothetical protein PBD2.143 [Rhodococcus erythropolis]
MLVFGGCSGGGQHPEEHATGQGCGGDEHQVYLRDGAVVTREVEGVEPGRKEQEHGVDDGPGCDVGNDPSGPAAGMGSQDQLLTTVEN